MKILFHLNSMGRGGAERVVSILSDRFIKAGHEVLIATLWYSAHEYPLPADAKRLHVGLTPEEEKKSRLSKILTRLVHLRACIQKEQPDLVVSFCVGPNFRAAYSMLGLNIPLLVSVRNDPLVDYAPHRFSTWWMQKKAVGCVFQTPTAMNFFSSDFQKRSRIIFNPVSEKYLSHESHHSAENKRNREIVNVGRITPQKNHQLLLEAFANIAPEFPDYTLKIYGDIQEQSTYESLIQFLRQKGLQERVLFMGDSDSLQTEIKDASLFVLSSKYEGMPNVLMEALVMGIPCISTDCPCGGSALLIQQNQSGILVPNEDAQALSDAMGKMLTDTHFAASCGEQGKKLLSQVHPDKIADEWIAFMHHCISFHLGGSLPS